MALNFPDVGENLVLEMIVNKTAPENLVLKLFSNDVTPSDSDTAGTYTEATFSGYSAATLTGASWGSASGGTITYGSQQTFTRDSTGATENIYGYYVIQTTSTTLLYSERDASAPFAVTNNGDAIKITPTISAN
jgi:hypothetical protein